jgi:probable phosphoglycerate mutase
MVILCRHGNTFDRGEKVVMVGAKQDLPLTNEGVHQARRIAEALGAARLAPARVLCGPLQRTTEYAATIVAELNLDIKPRIDGRLVELDYGAWGGLSQEEISERFGTEDLVNWQERGIRPASTSFVPSTEALRRETVELLREFQSYQGISVVVTSNGRLREFGSVLDPSTAVHHKVKTGHACVIVYEENQWRIRTWDSSPEQLAAALDR